jgi:HEAT repeat protein
LEVANELKTTGEFFTATLQGDYDDDQAWEAVGILRLRNTEEVFRTAVEYCSSEIPKKRARGLDVVAQLGTGKPLSERPWFDDCVSIAIRNLSDEDPLVVHSAAWALAHLRDDRAISALLEMSRYPDSGVRHAVAFGLAGSERPDALQTLINLMEDADNEVRDWATFGLGEQCKADSPEIRDALRKRTKDPYEDARSEAIWGLARRRDPVWLQALLDRLEADCWIQGDEIAAADILHVRSDTPIEALRTGLRELLDSLTP